MPHSRSFGFLIRFHVYCTLLVVGTTIVLAFEYPAKIWLDNIYQPSEQKLRRQYDVSSCRTGGCNYSASSIRKNMDFRVQPCKDFYKFACGGFMDNTVLPDYERKSVSQFSYQTLIEQLRTVIEKEISPDEPRAHKLVKNFYKACMNKDAIEEQGLQPLMDRIFNLGGWPVLEGYHVSHFNWTNYVSDLREMGFSINYFLKFDVKVRSVDGKGVSVTKKNSKNFIYLSSPTFGIPAYLLRQGFQNSDVQEYYKTMVEIAVLLGADRIRAEEEMRKSLEFELILAKISPRNRLYTGYAMTVNELEAAYPTIPWWEYLNNILAPISRLNQNETIIVESRDFLSNFEYLMNASSKRIQANYGLWRMVYESGELVHVIQKGNFGLVQRYPDAESKWKKCVHLVSNHLDFSVGSMYFDEKDRQSVTMMVRNIKREFKRMLEKLEWMDIITKEKALEKIFYMRDIIVYPEEYLDIKKLNKLYEKLELNPDDPLGNKLNMTIFETNRLVDLLNKPVKWNEWWRRNLSPVSNTAFYEIEENAIQIPASIMQQAIYFDKNRPQYLNYGAIGVIIGHEITHGFDDGGILYDKDGYLADWWDPETKQQFLDKTECIINQYENYTAEDIEMHLNGKRTLTENIADNGGVKAAYYAYQQWMRDNGIEERLPGLHFTSSQMFWISHANLQCIKYRQEWLENIIYYSRYTPNEFRVNGALSNMKEFARDFRCKEVTKMNPVKRCDVW